MLRSRPVLRGQNYKHPLARHVDSPVPSQSMKTVLECGESLESERFPVQLTWLRIDLIDRYCFGHFALL